MKQVNQNTKSIYRQSMQTLGTPLEFSSFTTSKLNRQHLNTSIRLTAYAPHTVILMAVCTERVQSHKQVIMALNTSTPFELLARSKWSAPREDNQLLNARPLQVRKPVPRQRNGCHQTSDFFFFSRRKSQISLHLYKQIECNKGLK